MSTTSTYTHKTTEEISALILSAQNISDVAQALQTEQKSLIWYLYRCPNADRYLRFSVPKKSGGTRLILSPANSLKMIQQRLADVLQHLYRAPESAHGFVKTRSILTNAKHHKGARHILNLDLKDFFPSINFGRVRGLFCSQPFNIAPGAATVLAQICCFDNLLPQGAPTSPAVSNFICWRLDKALAILAKKYGCRFSRYADDITFSTKAGYFPPQLARHSKDDSNITVVIGKELENAILSNGFFINDEKIRLTDSSTRMEITGLTVNQFPNVPRKFVREIRSMLHDWESRGLQHAEERFKSLYSKKHRHPNKPTPRFTDVIKGKLNFLRFIKKPNDPVYRALRIRFEKLDPNFKDLRLHNLHEGLLKATWIIQSPTDLTQGTAFWLKDIGIVTCAHCVKDDSVIYRADDLARETFPISVLHIDHNLDLAILSASTVPELELIPDFEFRIRAGEPVTFAGFPYHEDGHGLFRANASVSQRCLDRKTLNTYWRVTGQIVSGNSGGPVLNFKHRVIGVVSRGADSFSTDDQTQINGFIAISDLKRLQP